MKSDDDGDDVANRIKNEFSAVASAAKLAFDLSSKRNIKAEEVVKVCDDIDALTTTDTTALLANDWNLKGSALSFGRRNMLITMMKEDYDAYVATASFLSNRIPRMELPNVQDVPYPNTISAATTTTTTVGDDGLPLVADCTLDDLKFEDSLLDKLLLSIFRILVAKNTGQPNPEAPGIDGLLEQGRRFMLTPGQTAEAQNKMVYDTLGGLMTPVLPPFYRIFMSGIVPKLGTDLDGKQFGPWFYAPWLTSFVTPTFFGFLVGPSYPNNRKDGQPGGLVVEKCKFLQESGCKGLCLNQCKLPAQQFFAEELGLPLTVSPNFVTQECQWSFGEVPLSPEEDPSFPKGCLSGCQSREAMAGTFADAY